MLSIIIPNYNGRHLLERFLANNIKILENSHILFEIIIVDDASTDDSVFYVSQSFSTVKIVQNPRNLGFARTVNRGADLAQYPILWFLNNDIAIQVFGFSLIDHYLAQDNVFSVTPKIDRNVGDCIQNETPSIGFFRGGWVNTENIGLVNPNFVPVEGQSLFWGCGGGMFCRKDIFWVLGGFDPLFSPFYSEDLDLSYGAWKHGLKSIYSESVILYHQHSATISQLSKLYVTRIALRNKYLFTWKNLSDSSYIVSHIFMVLVKLVTIQIRDIRAVLSAIMLFSVLSHSRRKRQMSRIVSDRQVFTEFLSMIPYLERK